MGGRLAEALGVLGDHGFELVKTSRELGHALVRLAPCTPVVDSWCEPGPGQLLTLGRFGWRSGEMLFSGANGRDFVLLETFFCLESPEVPVSLLMMRDFFDYELEPELTFRFAELRPLFGPAWCYIYETVEVRKQLKRGTLDLSAPLVGTGLRTHGEDPLLLLDEHQAVKQAIREALPIPLVWGHPTDLPVGARDAIFDTAGGGWFLASLSDPSGEDMSIADLAHATDGEGSLFRHNFSARDVSRSPMDRGKLTLSVRAFDSGYRARRKVNRLRIRFG